MAVAPVWKLAMSNRWKPGSESTTSGIQAFKLQRQNRPREAYLINAEHVQARTYPREWQKCPNFKAKRQASATPPTISTTDALSTIVSTTVTITSGLPITSQPGLPLSVTPSTSIGTTDVLPTIVSTTVKITSGLPTTSQPGLPLSLPPGITLTLTITPSVTFITETLALTITPSVTFVTATPTGSNQVSLPTGSGIVTTIPGTIPGQALTTTIFPSLPAESGIARTIPGTIPGQIATTTIFPSSNSGIMTSTRLPPESPTNGSSALGASANSRTRLDHIVIGSVIGGLIPLLLLLCLFLRLRKHRRRTRPILLADPFPEVRGPQGQQGSRFITMPQPSAFGDAMVASTSNTSSPRPAKLTTLLPANPLESHARQDSISTTNSPGSNIFSPDTMLEIQALRQRILEVENMALRQRVLDAENTSRGRQDMGDSSAGPRVDRASESPPEYISRVDETRPPHGQN